MEELVLQSIAVSTVLGMAGLLLGRWLRVPAILFLMLLGLLAGPTFLGWIRPEALRTLMMPFIEVAVAIIIFEAGLALPISGIKTDSRAIIRILAIVLPVTAVAAMLIARFIVDLPWASAALFGSIIVVTGPTVIGPLLRNVALNQKVDKLFRWESVWADCLGVLLAGVVLQGVMTRVNAGLLPEFIGMLLTGFVIGIVSGILLGKFIMPWILRLGDAGLPGIVVLTSAIGIFFVANTLKESSGVVAAACAGFVLARYPIIELENIKHFKDQVTRLIVAFLFVILSANLELKSVDVPWVSLIIASLVLIFVVRPVVTVAALYNSSLKIKESLYVGLIGPRGIISAAVVSYLGVVLSDPVYRMDEMILLTFITIFISGGFVSLSGKPLARLLGVSLPDHKTGIALIGYSEFTKQIALLLRRYVSIVIVDSNPDKCYRAMRECSRSICENALSDKIYEELLEQGFRRVLVLTPNAPLNKLIAEKAKNHLGGDSVYITVGGGRDTERSIKKMSVNILAFSGAGFDIATADEMIIQKEARIDRVDLENISEDVSYETLAFETPDGGIKIAKAEQETSGKAICFIFEKQTPVN
ncbi:MAG: cation:proton antiporter [bacterium]